MPTSSTNSSSMLQRGSYAWFIALLTISLVVVSALGFLLAGGPASNQAPVHQWMGLALAGSMIIHLLLHRTWLSRVLRWKPGKLPRRTRVNRGLTVALLVLVAVLLVSGLGLGGLFGGDLARGAPWQGLHHFAGKLMLLLSTWHIVRHRRWFLRRLRLHDTARLA